MQWSNIKLILGREIRDQLRDRRTLFMIVVLPVLLYPLLGMSFFQIAQFMREHPTRVLVLGAPDAEGFGAGLPRLIEDRHFNPKLFSGDKSADLLELQFAAGDAPHDPSLNQQFHEQQLEQARQDVKQGVFDVVVYFPPDFADRLEEFRAKLLELEQHPEEFDKHTWDIPSPTLYYNTANEKSQIAYTRVTRVLDRWADEIGEQNLRDSRVPVEAARPFAFEKDDVAASGGHRDAAVWSKVLPFVLLIWALTGAFYPAIDLCAGEKERGTLETLLSSPAERSEIVWGKLLTIMLFSVATSVLNLLCMGMTGLLVVSQLNQLSLPTPAAQLSTPPAITILWLILALLPVSAMFSALCLALAAFARSTKEGQYYLMPLVLISMPLMILPMAPGVELTLGNSLIPVTGVVLLLRAMIEGNYLQAVPFVLPVAVVTLGCCWLAIRWAVDQFNQESVLFRESERLDLGLWVRHLVRDRGATPTIAEGIACFVLIMMIQFFISLAQGEPPSDFVSMAQMVFISQVVVIALPTLLMTIMLTRSPRQTLLLQSSPSLLSLPVAVLLAVALNPLVQGLGIVVQYLYPVSPEIAEASNSMIRLLDDAPYAWMPYLLIAVLPAVCEELTFRGFILSGLRHIGHKWWAILISAVFFGMVHTMLQQSLMAVLMGAVIGYIAVQTGNLLPCILFHLTHNSLGYLSAQIKLSADVFTRYPGLGYLIERTEAGGYLFRWPVILAGAMVAGYLFSWLYRLPYQKTLEEELQEALDHQSSWEMTGS